MQDVQFAGMMIDINHILPTLININQGTPEDEAKPVVVYDLDGTLFNHDHRKEHVEVHNYDEYRKTIHKDEPHWGVVKHLIEQKQNGAVIALLTGRSDDLVSPTLRQIYKAGFAPYVSFLMMRPKFYEGKVIDHKLNALNLLSQDGSLIAAVVDDDPEVREMVEALNIQAVNPMDIIEYEQSQEIQKKIANPSLVSEEKTASGIVIARG